MYSETYNPPVAPVAAAALPPEAENAPSRTGKHSGPEGRNSAEGRLLLLLRLNLLVLFPGALPLASAGVGGYIYVYNMYIIYFFKLLYRDRSMSLSFHLCVDVV